MSRTVDLFIDSDQPLEQVAAELSDLTGTQLVPSSDRTRFVLHRDGVTAYLAEHDFIDDDDLPLSEFRFVLSAPVRSNGLIDDSAEVAYLREVNSALRHRAQLASLLVIDLERPDTASTPAQ
ncbi:MAG TPA: hypothetical protein VME46_16880 [Acidimicrobiales bacterium]|nr:hypothetical protein [Acidimicrobiales bacterium]